MRTWHIIVETEDGRREAVGKPSADLEDIMTRAIALADELGRVTASYPRDCRVDIVAYDDQIELSIRVITGGLDPHEASAGS